MASDYRGPAGEDPRPEEGEGSAALEDSALASNDRDPAGADRVTALERRTRLLLRLYPADYRRERGEEMIGTLLETTPDGRAWPRLRDARALGVGGLKARAAQNRRLSTAANLRVAIMAGVSLYLATLAGEYLASVASAFGPNSQSVPGWSAWPAALAGLFIAATVVLAWTAPRLVVLVSAVLAAAAVSWFDFAIGQTHLSAPAVTQTMCLAALVALVPRTPRPSRRWLWLMGSVAAMAVLPSVPLGYWYWSFSPLLTPQALVLATGIVGIAWIGIDARLAVAVMTCIVVTLLESRAVIYGNGAGFPAQLGLLLIFAAVEVPAIWLLRRQSGRAVG
jgi:hypothetical protein